MKKNQYYYRVKNGKVEKILGFIENGYFYFSNKVMSSDSALSINDFNSPIRNTPDGAIRSIKSFVNSEINDHKIQLRKYKKQLNSIVTAEREWENEKKKSSS